MLIRKKSDLRASEITPQGVYERRREVLKLFGLALPGLLIGCGRGSDASAEATAAATPNIPSTLPELTIAKRGAFSTTEAQTSYQDATHYNNFYEFGTSKADPARNSGRFRPQPWTVEIAGNAEITGKFSLEDILKPHALEERIYRMRCVEGWSMVIPWVGFPLADLIARFKPTSAAKYVAFTGVERPKEMPGQNDAVLDWPYREGLRMDEAMNPLTLLVVGLYGHALPNQNGAPLRLVVPWKYGFKGIKSIVKIEFVESQPRTAWNLAARSEYGFFANVNPEVDHPRWSQATERRISGGGFTLLGNRMLTQPFNGYADQVASMYAGMNLRQDF
jgi:sulfoxide reductase catalytic subunit YedY